MRKTLAKLHKRAQGPAGQTIACTEEEVGLQKGGIRFSYADKDIHAYGRRARSEISNKSANKTKFITTDEPP